MHLTTSQGFNFAIIAVRHPLDSPADAASIKYLTATAASLLGYTPNELDKQPLRAILTAPHSLDLWNVKISETLRSRQSRSFACQLLKRNGQPLPAFVTLSPVPDEAGDSSELVLLLQANDSQRENQENLSIMQMAVEQSASAVMIADAHGTIEYVNPKFTELTGYSREELLGSNPRILRSEDTSPEQYQAMFELLYETGEWRGEIKNKKKNGEFYWAYECISTIKNDREEITHFLAVQEDVTLRKQVESALKESEQRFRQMAEMTGEWLWEQDPEGYYIYSSSAVKQILGFTPEEIIGKHYLDLLTPQDRAMMRPSSTIQAPFYSLVNHYQHRDGHEVFTESTGLPITNEEGKLVKWRGVDRDITAHKHFQDALIESEKRKRLMFETALNSIIIMDCYGIITDWNRQAVKMFGWCKEEAIGQNLAQLIIPERFRTAHTRGLTHFLRGGESKILNKLTEHTAVRRDGSEFPVEFSVSPLKIGNVYEFSGFIHDISDRKEKERKIRQAEVRLAITRNEMHIAHQIQKSLLPAEPIRSRHFHVTGYCLPADQVGGDYYDYFFRDQDNLDIIIADVSGHSIGPALFMAETRSALRTQANWPGTPAQTLQMLNDFMFADLNNADYFITMFYLQYNILSEQLRFSCAGHPSAIYWDSSARHCKLLDTDGLILGVKKEVEFQEKTLPFKAGDIVMLYTDGFIEAENAAGEFYGMERLKKLFSQLSDREPEDIIENILEALKQFCQSDSFNDDMTLVIFKRG